MNTFEPNQRVRAIITLGTEPNKIVKGEVYTVKHASKVLSGATQIVYLDDARHNGWFNTRFEPVVETSRVKRDKQGRFVSNVPARPQPVALRNGSLYSVKRKRGAVVARLRKAAHGDWLVFSEHDKAPFLARRKQVTLANEEEVKTYLQTKV